MENWEKSISLEDLMSKDWVALDRGKVISSKDLASHPGNYPVYSSSAQKNGFFGAYDLYDFDEELITWSVDGGGYFFYRPKHKFSVTNVSGILRILNKEKLNYKFLYYLFAYQHSKQAFDYVEKAHPSVIKRRYFVPEISVSEQTQIATILSKVDEAITQIEQLIAKYTRIKTGLMQDLLTKGIDENGNIRSEETHEFKNEKGIVYPKEWELTSIEKCIKSIEQGWSPNCESDPAPLGQWGILKTTAISWEGYYELENKRMPKILTPKKQYEVKKEDVLITRAGPNSRVGVVSFVSETRDKLIFSDKIYRLVPKKQVLNRYLAFVLSSQFTQRHLSQFKTGMAESQTNISQKIVLALNVLIPSPKEQERIIEKIDKTEVLLTTLTKELSKLQSLKTGLMQDLLSGKVRVNHLLIETASI